MAEVEVEHTLAATVNAAELCSVAEPDHFVGETALLEEFERARLDAGGARCRGRALHACRSGARPRPCATIPAQP